jgi:soluble lytic murein transglycosylase
LFPALLPVLIAASASLAAAAPKVETKTKAKAKASDRPTAALADLGRGYRSYRAGDYADATKALNTVIGKGLRVDDWAVFLLAESEFYSGEYRAARGHFEKAARSAGRPGDMAPARVADCLWMEGERSKAAGAYARVIKAAAKRPTPFVDVGVARFRVAQVAAARSFKAGQKQFLALAKDLPAHPLADEALRLAVPESDRPEPPPPPLVTSPKTAGPPQGLKPPVAQAPAPPAAPAPPPGPVLAPADRLRRAETLSKDRHWDEALVELGRLPADLPGELAIERDFQIGMTKFHMRRDYAKAAELLLGVAPRLSGERAAEAAFHGARALSRVDRDDEAIAGYKKVVEQYPRSRWAAEAQYLSGWLDYNRGRFRESLPGLHATLDRYGNSAFADDAAWCVAFAHFLLGEADAAFAGLARYAKMPATGMTADERAAQVAYWRARLHEKIGHKDEATTGYRELVRARPLSYYGLLAAARLGDVPVELAPRPTTDEAAPPAIEKAERDPVVARVLELLEAGLNVEAGAELQRAEKDVLKRAGGEKALPWLLGLYRRTESYHRAYALAESRGASALAAAPTGVARAFWEAAYPRAYAPLVEKYGPPAGNPDLLLYAIMRKESGFNPLDVSYADARGLLQMIPPTSARVAATAKISFAPDELYDPETNVKLGAIYIGSLFEKFGGQIPLTAGAYNAGPRAMTKWCEQHPRHPTDEFVELIAFAQTREYAKRVTALYARYRYLYGPSPYKVPLALQTKVAAQGPDY